MTTVHIGDRLVGDGQPALVIGEVGINANGDIDLAKRLITLAAWAGCEAVKFQKRTVDVVYTAEELARPRESPFGTTNGDLKRGLEFGESEYQQIAEHCVETGIMWSASPWDIASVDFLEKFDVPFYKVASASLTDLELLARIRDTGRPVILSTGMSNPDEIADAVYTLCPFEDGPIDNLMLLHCTSTYPTATEELNLSVIPKLREEWGVPVGFSSHESGIIASVAAVALGACVIERHITRSRDMWGSDQAASLEPLELAEMVSQIRTVETALGDGIKVVYPSELPIRDKLRRV